MGGEKLGLLFFSYQLVKGHGPRRWPGSDLLLLSPEVWMMTKKVLFLLLEEREEQSKKCCWKGRLVAEHQPLLTVASSNSPALLSSLCPSVLVQLQAREHRGCLHRERREGWAVCLTEVRNVPVGMRGRCCLKKIPAGEVRQGEESGEQGTWRLSGDGSHFSSVSIEWGWCGSCV